MAKLEEILGKSIDSTKELKAEIIRLQDSIKNLGTDENALNSTTQKLNAAQSEYDRVMAQGKRNMDVARDSIKGMQQEYKNLYNTYMQLSKAQRETDFGKEMAKSLDTLSKKLNETKTNVGNFKDNVGRYTGSIMDAFNKMGISLGGLQGPLKAVGDMGELAGSKLSKIGMSNPYIMAVVVAITALVAILKGAWEGIQNNEESSNRLQLALAKLQPVINMVKNALNALGPILLDIIEGFVSFADTVIDVSTKITDFFHITKDANKTYKEQQQATVAITKATQDLTKAKREAKSQNATDEKEIANLKNLATNAKTAKERTEALNKAKELQKQVNERNVNIAKEEYRIMEENSKLTANSAEDNDRLAEAKAHIAEVEAEATDKLNAFDKKLNANTGTVNAATTAANKFTQALEEEKKKLDELLKRIGTDSKTEIQILEEKYKDEKDLLEKYGKDTTKLTEQYNKKRNELENKRIAEQRKAVENSRKLLVDSLSTNTVEMNEQLLENAKKDLAEFQKQYQGVIQPIVDKLNDTGLTDEARTKLEDNLTDAIQRLGKRFSAELNTLEDAINFPKVLENAITKATADLKNSKVEAQVAKDTKLVLDSVLEELKDVFLDDKKFADGNGFMYDFIDKILYGYDNSLGSKVTPDGIKGHYKMQSEVIYDYFETIAKGTAQRLQNNINAAWNKWITAKNEGLPAEEITKAEIEYYDALDEKRQYDYDRFSTYMDLKKQRAAELKDSMFEAIDSVDNLIGSWASLTKAEIQNGNLSEKEIKKKEKLLKTLEAVQTVVGIASIIADTTSGIMGVWKGYGQELILNAQTAAAAGPGAAAAKAALDAKSLANAWLRTGALTTTGAAQLIALRAKRLSSQTSSESSSGGAAAVPALIDSTPYTYTRTVQTQEEEDAMNRPIYVSVTDINEVQNKVQVVEEESSF